MEISDSKHSRSGEILLKIMVFALILSVMNGTIFNVAVPSIIQEFHLYPSEVSWVITAYMIVYSIGTLTYGKLADKYRLKDLVTIGICFFSFGSVIGFCAIEYWMVIIGRILQSIGAAVIPAVSLIIPVRYFPPEKRGRALGIISIGLSLGVALGPIISGVITYFINWRYLFLLPLLSLFLLPLFRKHLNDEEVHNTKFDFLGGLLLASAVTVLLLYITIGGVWGWLLTSVMLFVLFFLRIKYAEEPFIPFSLLKNINYAVLMLVTFLAQGLTFGLLFILPLMLSEVNHVSSLFIGLILFPGAAISALVGNNAGSLADKKGNLFLVYIAITLLFLSFISFSFVGTVSLILAALLFLFTYFGRTLLQIALSNLVSLTINKEQTGIGMGFFSMINFISAATATALTGKALDFGHNFVLNPFLIHSSMIKFSNVFIIYSIVTIIVSLFIYLRFGRIEHKLL